MSIVSLIMFGQDNKRDATGVPTERDEGEDTHISTTSSVHTFTDRAITRVGHEE